MANIVLELIPIADVTIAAPNVAQPLSVASLRVSGVVLQYDPANSDDVYLGDSTVAAGKSLLLNNAYPLVKIRADESYADEDFIYVDLADLYVSSPSAGQVIKIAYIKVKSVEY